LNAKNPALDHLGIKLLDLFQSQTE